MTRSPNGDRDQDDLSDPGVVEVGREMARAVEAEERHRTQHGDRLSPLGGAAYDVWAGTMDLYRWVESPVDEVVRGFVRGYEPLPADRRAELRANLTMDDFYTLLAFARRCALAALRAGEPTLIREGVIALTATDAERVDWRDVSVAAALLSYVGGHDANEVLRDASKDADQTVSEILLRFAREPVDDLVDWGYRKVTTANGLAFFEDNGARYEPAVDLAGLAVHIAALLEEDVYRVSSIGVGNDLPDVWVRGGDREAVSRAVDSLAGCAVVQTVLDPASGPHAEAQQLTVFVAETEDEADAELLAGAAEADGPRSYEVVGVAAGNACCVVIARSFVEGVPAFEKPKALERFRAPLSTLLEAATAG